MTKDEALKLALDALDSKFIVNCGEWQGQRTKAITAIKEALAQPEQEPSITKTGCGVLTLHSGFDDLPDGTKFYTTPPKRPWVGLGLTVVEIMREWHSANDSVVDFARAIEAKLKEKNT